MTWCVCVCWGVCINSILLCSVAPIVAFHLFILFFRPSLPSFHSVYCLSFHPHATILLSCNSITALQIVPFIVYEYSCTYISFPCTNMNNIDHNVLSSPRVTLNKQKHSKNFHSISFSSTHHSSSSIFNSHFSCCSMASQGLARLGAAQCSIVCFGIVTTAGCPS